MKKRILSLLLVLCLVAGLLPTVALAADTAPAGIAAGLGALEANERGTSNRPGDTVYFGNIPWNLLDKEYETGTENNTGYLFLSQYAYNGGTQWNAYYTNSNPSDGNGYTDSDIRTYLTGKGTYTAFKPVGAYGPSENAADNYTCYWERHEKTEDSPVKDRVYFTKSTNEVYTQVDNLIESDWKSGVWYTRSGTEGSYTYTLSKDSSIASSTTYYREDTAYEPADVSNGFAEDTTYYYFTKPTGKVNNEHNTEVTNNAGGNLARAYYYAGGSITPAASISANGGYRVVGGMNPEQSDVSFAKDHDISDKEIKAIAPVTANSENSYTVVRNDAKETYSYYGDKLNGDTFFLLSAKEAAPLSEENANGYWTTQAERIARYAGASSAYWWLRSSYNTGNSGNVSSSGLLSVTYATNTVLGVRPAFVLNPESVFFASAAEGGKSNASAASASDGGGAAAANFVNLADAATNTWKLTLKDDSLTLGENTFLADDGEGGYTVYYQDASKYGDHVYVSAILTDATGNTIYGYAKLAAVANENAKSGSAGLTLPEGITLGEGSNYKLKVFLEEANETKNGVVHTDYAGTPIELTPKTLSKIEVTTAPTKTTYTAGDDFDPTKMQVTATYGEDDASTTVLADGAYTVSYPTTDYAENQNDGVFHIKATTANGGTLTDDGEEQNVTITFNSKTATQKVTVKGIEQPIPGGELAVVKTASGWKTEYTGNKALQTSDNDNFSNPTDYAEITNTENSSKLVYVRYKAYGDCAPGAVQPVTLPAANAKTYEVDISLTKDGKTWTGYDSGMEYNLINNETGGTSYYHYNSSKTVVAGTYSIWATNGDNQLADTGKDVTVSDADVTATVPYVTATFKSNIPQEPNVVTPVISGVAYAANNEKTTMEQYAANHNLAFTGFAAVNDNTITISEAATYTAQYGVNDADAKGVECSVTELTNGNTIPTPADAVLDVAGNEQEAAWTIKTGNTNAAEISGNATQGTAYQYVATFTAPDGYTFTNDLVTALNGEGGSSWTKSEDGKTLAKTFAAITAGYPINVTDLPDDAVSVKYQLDSGEMTTYSLPVTDGKVTLSASSTSETALTLKTDKNVTYTGTVTFTENVGSAALTQQAPAVTMYPSGTSADQAVSRNITELTLTFDQAVTLNTDKNVTLYAFSSVTNQNNFVPTATYKLSLSKATLSEDGKTLLLPIGAFTSGSTVLSLSNGYYYTVAPEEGFAASKYGGESVSVSFQGKFTCANATGSIPYYVGAPANGTIRGTDSRGNVVASGTSTYYLEDGMSVTLSAVPNTGYAFESYTVVVSGTLYTFADADELAQKNLSWITWNADGGLTLQPVATTFTLLADFKADDTVEYTFTQTAESVTVSVGSSQTLSYTVMPSATVKLESGSVSIASVSGSTVTGKKVGETTVTAYAPDGVTALGSWKISVVATQTGTPVITTDGANSISMTGATLSASYSGDGFEVTEAGIRIKAVGGANEDFKMSSVPTDGKISVAVSGLTPGATYYYTGYVRTANGSIYTDSVYSNLDIAKKFTTTQPSGGGGGGGGGTGTPAEPTISVGAGGTVKLDGSTLTITPDAGYQVKDVTVNGKSQGAVTKVTGLKASDKVVVTFQPIAEPAPENSFVDVPANAYYADAVDWAVAKGITTGTSKTTFSPDASCTRAQMVTFLWRAAGSPKATGNNPFADVTTGSYYYDAVLWAVEQGITSGTSATTFSPDATVTRGQTVTFLYRYADSPAVSGSSFGDVSADAYYTDAVKWAVANGITNGTSNTTFSPDADCTRGQIVTFLYRDLAD